MEHWELQIKLIKKCNLYININYFHLIVIPPSEVVASMKYAGG